MTLARKLYESTWPPVLPMTPWDHLTAEGQAHYEQLADVATRELAGSDEATSGALTERMLDVISNLLLNPTANDVRAAQALLVDGGRKLPEPEPAPAEACTVCGVILGQWTRVHFAQATDGKPCKGSWPTAGKAK